MGWAICHPDSRGAGVAVNIIATTLPGAFIIKPERIDDERGYFARTFCRETFACHGLATEFVQCSTSYNAHAGTLRGMHYQQPPYSEAKLVRCTRGAIYDAIIDLRASSPTYRKWHAIVLSAENGYMLYVPEGIAHGFQTLEAESEVFYQISTQYMPDHAAGVRWNDPAFAVEWPTVKQRIISFKDQSYPDYRNA